MKTIGWSTVALLVIIAVVWIEVVIVDWLYHSVIVAKFSFPEMTRWEILGLLVLIQIVFGSTSRQGVNKE